MPTSKTVKRHRRAAYLRQHGQCFYCNDPMWIEQPEQFAAVHCLPPEVVGLFACTAEHLIARQDGGTDAAGNIAAACWSCNQGRHAQPNAAQSAEAYRRQVRARSG